MTDTDAGERPDQPAGSEPEAPGAPRPAAEPTPVPSSAPEARDRPVAAATGDADGDGPSAEAGGDGEGGEGGAPRPRRRGSRGGRSRNRPRAEGAEGADDQDDVDEPSGGDDERPATRPRAARPAPVSEGEDDRQPELPDRHRENQPSAEAAEAALVRRPKIGDTRPAAPADDADAPKAAAEQGTGGAEGATGAKKRRRRGGRGRGGSGGGQGAAGGQAAPAESGQQRARTEGGRGDGGRNGDGGSRRGQGGRSGGRPAGTPVTAITDDAPVDLDEKTLSKRRGKERKGRPVGRYLMAVHVQPSATQIAVLEGRSLIEHYVSRPADEVTQIHGNIYLGKVQNVLPGMEAAFVDIGTPKNAVLYRGDTRHDPEDLDQKGGDLRIEQMLKARQTILCQVTKNPIGAKGARLTQEISLPGRFVVLVPNSTTYGISKRLPDNERKRLRQVLDKVKPQGHGLIVRTAAEGISAEELQHDVARLAKQWAEIEALAAKSQAPALLYRDPDLSIRVIREEFNTDYRQVVIDDEAVYEQVRDYVRSISPALVERVELYDPADHGGLPIYEHHHVHEQLHKAIDRKVWLPSGGSLIIERTEALTVIDVNTGKNVGKSSLEETVFRNNLEAAEEVARQLRLRDIGGIIVIDFIDMEIRANREQVISTFRQALSRDKTRTQVFDISELGLVEMTRKRIGEGLIESLSSGCPTCEGRGMVFDKALLGD
ncbi:Rne/Rng family ribonuclease [Aquihabitans sp. G128]|uniref:Rne/Rng family ribonuclease n=1 Tax=Aquihabitans sp. G128 TaxID=2849779 RepID=UPI001C21AF73|nr:Rne/Rng family ribonuclease [Aquihabitans sp. G128]QXC62720.1 Rne/Rng family ribonuclease [Aquihabitans sp. G128]